MPRYIPNKTYDNLCTSRVDLEFMSHGLSNEVVLREIKIIKNWPDSSFN